MNACNYIPGAAAFLTALYFLGVMIPPSDPEGGFHLQKFGRLPIVDRGRVQPIDTFARINLMLVNEGQTFKEFRTWQDFKDNNTKTATAVKWLLDSMAYSTPVDYALEKETRRSPVAFHHHVLRIENDQVRDLLNLEARPGFYRYTLAEIQPRFMEYQEEAERIQEIDPKSHKLYEAKMMQLGQRLRICLGLIQGSSPLVVPPAGPGKDKEWMSLRDSLVGMLQQQAPPGNDGLRHWMRMLVAYREGNAEAFNKSLDEYTNLVADLVPQSSARMGLEVFSNNFNPTAHCRVLYGALFMLACLSWIVWPQTLNRAVFWTMVVVLAVHTFALISRMVVQGRPPVTNLYSSAVFIGWTAVLTCLFVERFYRNSMALAVGALVGFCSLVIAYYWSLDGDTLQMMQAVLDTNFWLATHVTTMVYGYSTTIIAGWMGAAYILLGLFTPVLSKGGATQLSKATYGVVCFAMFLSFVGTVLGGIWADQSWGRFWGWDPKENGAILVVIWNALILHARWAGIVKQRGIAVLAVFGTVITAWSYVGTNQLGVGLHAYGSTEGTLRNMLLFDALMVGIMLLGLTPLRLWTSFRPSIPKNVQPPISAATS